MTDAAGGGMAPVPLTDVTGAAAVRGPRRAPRRVGALPYGLRKGRETGRGAHGDKAAGRRSGSPAGILGHDADAF